MGVCKSDHMHLILLRKAKDYFGRISSNDGVFFILFLLLLFTYKDAPFCYSVVSPDSLYIVLGKTQILLLHGDKTRPRRALLLGFSAELSSGPCWMSVGNVVYDVLIRHTSSASMPGCW